METFRLSRHSYRSVQTLLDAFPGFLPVLISNSVLPHYGDPNAARSSVTDSKLYDGLQPAVVSSSMHNDLRAQLRGNPVRCRVRLRRSLADARNPGYTILYRNEYVHGTT